MLIPQIYLASTSPRRRELLHQIGIGYQVLEITLMERRHANELPEMYVVRLAVDKARAGWNMVKGSNPLPVLGADTAVVVDDEILGKPADFQDCMAMLTRLSGRVHHVYTGVALVSDVEETRLSVSTVTFRNIDDDEQMAYCASGESLDKAGGYAIQGRAAVFVAHLAGSYTGVMGLPLYETAELLMEAGIDIFSDIAVK